MTTSDASTSRRLPLHWKMLIGFIAGLPQSVGGATINRFCGSSMTSVHFAAGQIMLGAGEAFLCAGVESMTRVPMGGFNISPNPSLMSSFPQVYMAMGHTAEEVAKRYSIGREEQEAMAVESHAKAARARELGYFRDEIVAMETPDGVVSEDGCIRPGTSLEALAQLKPAFGGSVTAATSSPLTDGSAAVLRSVADAPAGARLRIRLSDGAVGATSSGPTDGVP